MKFKIDENLPIELANLLQDEGYDASTIYSESLKGAKDRSLLSQRLKRRSPYKLLQIQNPSYSTNNRQILLKT